jgi:hypothetical protein
MGKPFKMKGSPMQRNFGISPAKQKPEGFNWTGSKEAKSRWHFEKFQSQKQKGKDFVKNLKKQGLKIGGQGLKTLGKRALGVLGFMGGGSLSATAGNVRKKSEGEQIKDLLEKLNQ